jgi:hypothetical protein
MLVPHKANYGCHRSEMRRNDRGSLPIGAAADTKKRQISAIWTKACAYLSEVAPRAG